MLMTVSVVKRQASRAECMELRTDLGCQFFSGMSRKKVAKTQGKLVRAEAPIGFGDARERRMAEHRVTFNQHKMQSDPQLGQTLGAANRIRGCGACDH